MARVEKTIEVNVPVSTAYNQWTQFEEFPKFMEGVHEVRQVDDTHLHWRAEIAGREKEWDAEIREQVPDQKIIWRATDGAENAGMVKFDPIGPAKTRVHLEMSYDPEGFVENVGDALGFASRRVEGDLQRFKDFIESRGVETGAYRREHHNPDVPGGHTRGSLDADEPGRSDGDQLRGGYGAGTTTPGGMTAAREQMGTREVITSDDYAEGDYERRERHVGAGIDFTGTGRSDDQYERGASGSQTGMSTGERPTFETPDTSRRGMSGMHEAGTSYTGTGSGPDVDPFQTSGMGAREQGTISGTGSYGTTDSPSVTGRDAGQGFGARTPGMHQDDPQLPTIGGADPGTGMREPRNRIDDPQRTGDIAGEWTGSSAPMGGMTDPDREGRAYDETPGAMRPGSLSREAHQRRGEGPGPTANAWSDGGEDALQGPGTEPGGRPGETRL